MSRKIASTILLWSLLFVFACKKKDASVSEVDFKTGFSMKSQYVESSSELVVTVYLADSLHAYAQGEKIGKPVSLEIVDKSGWSAEGPAHIPPGKTKSLGELGKSIVLTGDFTIRQKLKKGSGIGEALLHMQVCSENVCDRPRIHSLPIEAPTVRQQVKN